MTSSAPRRRLASEIDSRSTTIGRWNGRGSVSCSETTCIRRYFPIASGSIRESRRTGAPDRHFYVDAPRARESLRTRRPFNIIDTEYASKIDLIIRRDREFSINELARRTTADL